MLPTTTNVKTQTSEFYVKDYANIFSDEQKKELISKAIELNDTYNGVQVVIYTVEELQEKSLESYANYLYEQYAIGKDSMGILILFSKADKEIIIERGEYMRYYIPESISDGIAYKYMDYFKEDEFAQGLILVQSTVINEIKEKVPTDWEEIREKHNRNCTLASAFFFIISLSEINIVIFLLYLDSKVKHNKEL